eukprot:TRINITY_DN7036_c0_g1_i1.p1 TRINITY_DN7036_c0_g1~~TRINITY_DN7036_c0_g1_i1.p1  ORF type:complete len:90 (+),score=4.70 TRINITY_DN7036_c0_g1_i1:147-416(+)
MSLTSEISGGCGTTCRFTISLSKKSSGDFVMHRAESTTDPTVAVLADQGDVALSTFLKIPNSELALKRQVNTDDAALSLYDGELLSTKG